METKFKFLNKENVYIQPVSRIIQVKEEHKKIIEDVEDILKRMRKNNGISKKP